jgi:nucleoid-associated protein YgaU
MSDTMSDMEKLVETAAEQAQATNNYETVGLFLVQKGYSAAGAAGVCGCIAGESGGDPEAVQFPSDPESGGAGLIQWTPASSMEQFGGSCAAAGIGNNSTAVDLQNQLTAILAYNNAQGASNVAELNAQTDPVAAADFYSMEFERPVVALSDVRPSIAQSVFAFLTGASAPVPGQEYMIQSGDTLFKIATAAYGANNANAGVTAIEAANPGINPNNLQVGQEIKIPVLGGTAPVPGQEYTIRAGDTLFNIATAAYGAGNANAGVTAIEAANPGINPNNLQVGQEIKIPVL